MQAKSLSLCLKLFTREHKCLPVNFVLNLFGEIFSPEWQKGTVPLFLILFLKY